MTPPRSALCSDTRARVPFALIGVLLLVTSSAYAVGLTEQGLITTDRSVEHAVERAESDTTAALKAAAREAAHAAANEPVTRPADDDDVHGAIRSDSAYTDAFRIRLAVAGTDALEPIETDVGDATATVSMPPIEHESDLTAARERVHVSPAANGTATRVTFSDITVRAKLNGELVTEQNDTRTVVVAVPTLAAHERAEQFETRLNTGPTEGAGLGRQLTASLYPMAWARGYAQYAGAPVQNVIANRHVELSTNAGVVRIQRDVFGTSDPAARGGVARGAAQTGLTDLLAPAGVDERSWTNTVLSAPTPTTSSADTNDPGDREITDEAGTGEAGTDEFGADEAASESAMFDAGVDPSDERGTVAVGHAADVAATEVYDNIEEISSGAYRVRASVETRTIKQRDGGTPRPAAPNTASGREWERINTDRAERITAVTGTGVPSGVPSGTVRPGERISFGDATRSVSVRRTARTTWERTVLVRDENGSVVDTTTERRTTGAAVTDRYRVATRVTGWHAPTDEAPFRATATFGAGDTAAGTDLQSTPGAARASLGVETTSQIDQIARQAVNSGDISRTTTEYGTQTAAERDRITADIATVTAEVRAVETDQSMAAAALGESDPHGELAAAIRAQHEALVDPPREYDGTTDRARVAVRVTYLDAVVEELSTTATASDTATDAFLDRVADAFDGPSVGEAIASREAARDPGTHTVAPGGPGGAVTFAPRGSPGYLPRTTVDSSTVDAVEGTTTRPLAVRNINYATVPYGDVSGSIVDRILGTEDTVRVETAGRALLFADDALSTTADPDLQADRNELATRVEWSLEAVDTELERVLADRTQLTASERQQALRAAAKTHETAGDQAVAVGDGTYPDRVASAAAARGSLSAAEEAALESYLRVTTRHAAGRDAVRIPTRFVEDPTNGARLVVRNRMEDAVEAGVTEVGERTAKRWAPQPARSVGAGMPVAPVPGYWVATVNAWRVQVRGEYPRFVLHADVGTPDRPFEYVRSEGTARIDLDGKPVTLGVTEPLQFDTETVVVIAVPPGPPGVGDVDGTRDETSAGWPCPGTSAHSVDSDRSCTEE